MSIASPAYSGLDLSLEEASLFTRIDRERLPHHIAVVMDGNGRRASRRNMIRIEGRKAAMPAGQETRRPDPDLMIRTSGELRISNFLLRQIASSETLVTSTLWPDFRKADQYKAVLESQCRKKGFGGI